MISGNKTAINNTKIIIPQNGQMVQKTLEIVVLAIAQEIYVKIPTGGVTDPITIAITNKTPK